jgi:proteasome accessory factor C
VPVVADGEDHFIEEIAELLDVDATTVVRDLTSVGERYDTPGGFVEGLEVFIQANSVSVKTDHFLRPMRLTIAELHALDLGLAMLRAERGPPEWHAIDRARARTRKAVARLPREPLTDSPYAVSTESVGSAHLAVVREALGKRQKIRISYRRGSAAESSERVICPYRLILAGPVWYLVAYCERSNGIRVFRVDRMEKAKLLAEKCPPPDIAAIDEQLERGPVFVSDAPVKLRVRFSAKIARWIEEREQGTKEPDGSFVVEYPLADLDWGVRYVLRYGPEAEILSPPEARQAIRERLEAMLA